MTAAATEGSSSGSASDSDGGLDQADVEEPGDAREQAPR